MILSYVCLLKGGRRSPQKTPRTSWIQGSTLDLQINILSKRHVKVYGMTGVHDVLIPDTLLF